MYKPILFTSSHRNKQGRQREKKTGKIEKKIRKKGRKKEQMNVVGTGSVTNLKENLK